MVSDGILYLVASICLVVFAFTICPASNLCWNNFVFRIVFRNI
jgi:hypothetical protein